MSTEKWIASLEDESRSLKQGYEQAATSLQVYTQSKSFSTSKNQVTITASGSEYPQNDPERLIVTFNTDTGANTLAKLEMSTDNVNFPIWHRVPYSGGARWTVTAGSKNSGGVWVSTNYTFTVHSLVDGTISVTEVTS